MIRCPAGQAHQQYSCCIIRGFKLQRCMCWVPLAAMKPSMGLKASGLRPRQHLCMLLLVCWTLRPGKVAQGAPAGCGVGWLAASGLYHLWRLEYPSCIPDLLLLTGGWDRAPYLCWAVTVMSMMACSSCLAI